MGFSLLTRGPSLLRANPSVFGIAFTLCPGLFLFLPPWAFFGYLIGIEDSGCLLCADFSFRRMVPDRLRGRVDCCSAPLTHFSQSLPSPPKISFGSGALRRCRPVNRCPTLRPFPPPNESSPCAPLLVPPSFSCGCGTTITYFARFFCSFLPWGSYAPGNTCFRHLFVCFAANPFALLLLRNPDFTWFCSCARNLSPKKTGQDVVLNHAFSLFCAS